MAGPLRQPTAPPRNALIRLCQWLWPKLKWFWRIIVIGGGLTLALDIVRTGFTPKGFYINPTLLEWIYDHLPLVLAGGGLFLILTGVVWYFGRRVASPAQVLPTPQDRRALIRRLSDEYHRQQIQSLQEAAMKSLEGQEPMASRLSSASLVSWRMDVPGKASLAAPTPIVQAYDQASAGLLILGDPGVGKSTLLLELALGLLTRAEQDTTQPVPVLVNLSSWALNKPPLTISSWLEEQLHSMCGIQRHLSHAWIEQNELLLLLDGLDEMEPSARSTCVASIDAYRKRAEHVVALVVCSRREEYLAQEEKLPWLDTVEVQRLTPEQIEDYLKRVGEPLAVVQAALRSNATLRELVITPLLLSMVILAYQGKTVEDLPHLGSAEEQQRQVFEHYVTQMLEKRARKWHYSFQQTRQGLIWLAQQMQQRQLSEFYLEWLQRSWLSTERAQGLYPWCFGLLIGLVIGLVYWLFTGLVYGSFYGPVYGSFFGPFFGAQVTTLEKPAEILSLSWGRFLRGLVVGLPFGLTVLWFSGAVLFGLLVAMLFGLLVAMLFGLSITQLDKDKRLKPNQGMRNSGRNALLVGLFAGLDGGLGGGLLLGLKFGLVTGLGSALFFALSFVVPAGLYYGGGAYLNHYFLRFLLARSRVMPWHYVRFLEEATERKLLQSIGGGYRFIHPLFREYFASLRTEPSASTQSSSLSPQS